MPDQTITCPKCGTEIQITEALTDQIEQSIKAHYEAELAKKDKEIKDKAAALKKQEDTLKEKEQSINEQVDEKLKAERLKLDKQKKNLETQQQQMEEQVEAKLKEERKKIAEKEKAKILAEQAEKTQEIKDELEEKRKQLSEANKKELTLRKQQRKLEEEKENMELTVQRQLDQERKKIVQEAKAKAKEEELFKTKEKDDKIESLTKQINDLKRQAEQGSQERQGEAMEGALQEMLQQAFPFDRYEEVKKGQRGADILQIVRNNTGKECGKILWESKHTKSFSNKWVEKLKSDQQDAKAEIAVITTSALLPKEIDKMGELDGVWVTDFNLTLGLAMALRKGLLDVAKEKAVIANQDTLKDIIYRYITGKEFAMQIRAVAEAFSHMKDDLDKEKNAMERIWKKREKQIEKVLNNVAGIRGSLEGYLGPKALPSVDTFSFDSIAVDKGAV